jgi:hypothetical protein
MNKSRPRATRELPASVAHQLNLYALAATAAGVGALALAQPAEAKIVYTKAHKWLAPNSSFPLDLNHDGIVDFKLYRRSFIYHSTGGGPSIFIDDVRVKHPGSSNGVAGYYLYTYCCTASAIPAGTSVAQGRRFASSGFLAARLVYPSSVHCAGPWAFVKNRYLGFRFSIRGSVHYGWARLNVGCTLKGVNAVLTGYAYETIANKGIITGRTKGSDSNLIEPETLGHLARGIPAVRMRRLRQVFRPLTRPRSP